MKLRVTEELQLDTISESHFASEDLQKRVRRFAVLRAAQRALAPSSAQSADASEQQVIGGLRAQLARLTGWLEALDDGPTPGEVHEEIQRLDGTLDGFSRMVLGNVERLPLSQLRASLSRETHEQRVEVAALLELCMDAEPVPSRYLRVVDFLLTLLCADDRDGRWVVEFDPANLNDAVRQRGYQQGDVDSSVESRIVGRFQQAAERVVASEDATPVMKEMSAYKVDVAGFYFAPAILRCIIGYNVAARNHIEERMRRERAADAKIDDELGSFAPLYEDDPRNARNPAENTLPAHESPGVLAVQEAIRRRLVDAGGSEGAAGRIAAALDLDWLGPDDREALQESSRCDAHRLIRMTVVLGHLAMTVSSHARDFEALGLQIGQLDAWICALGEEVQGEIDTLIRDNAYDGAVRLGDTKSRFLAAVLLVARRRLGRNGPRAGSEEDALEREAIDLVRQHLERERLFHEGPMFGHLLGGGWRRTVAIVAVAIGLGCLVLTSLLPSGDPRAVDELERWQARELSPILSSAYRDHADEKSILIATVGAEWTETSHPMRQRHAEVIRTRAQARGVEEVMLLDEDRVLQAHFFEGAWRSAPAWGS